MANTYFQFKQFRVEQAQASMKVTTDGCLFGAWCATVIQQLKQPGKHLLDIGTGTGLTSLMISQKNELVIDAVEIDKAAVEEARVNIALAGFAGSINLVEKDIKKFKTGDYDFIVSNPPFYEKEIISAQAGKNTAHHSAELSWEVLFSLIAEKLKPEGNFFLLVPCKRNTELERFLKRNELFIYKKILVRQTPAHAHFRMLVYGGKQEAAMAQEELVIKDETNQYSPAFSQLLKDYYLYL